MNLFKGHAVMPRSADEPTHVVRTYLVIADTWQDAQLCICKREPGADFVTVPGEMPEPLMIDVRSISLRECEELRTASGRNEERLRKHLR